MACKVPSDLLSRRKFSFCLKDFRHIDVRLWPFSSFSHSFFFLKWNINNIYKRLTLIILPCHTNWTWSQHDTAAHVAFNVSHRRLVAVFRFPDLNLWPACCSPLRKLSLTHIFILNNQQHVISLRNPLKKTTFYFDTNNKLKGEMSNKVKLLKLLWF